MRQKRLNLLRINPRQRDQLVKRQIEQRIINLCVVAGVEQQLTDCAPVVTVGAVHAEHVAAPDSPCRNVIFEIIAPRRRDQKRRHRHDPARDRHELGRGRRLAVKRLRDIAL